MAESRTSLRAEHSAKTHGTHRVVCFLHLLMAAVFGIAYGADSNPEDSIPDGIRAESDRLLSDARRARLQNDNGKALECLGKAESINPADPRIASERQLLLLSTGDRSFSQSLRQQWAIAQLRQARIRAEAMYSAKRPEDAHEQLSIVRASLVGRGLTDDVVMEEIGINDKLDAMISAKLPPSREPSDQSSLDISRQHATDDDHAAKRAVDEQLARIADLEAHGHLEQALGECRVLTDRNPQREDVRSRYATLLRAAHHQRALDTESRDLELKQEISERLQLGLIPDIKDDLPVYPENWHQRRVRNTIDTVAEPEWQVNLRNALRRRIPVEFHEANGIEALQALSRDAGATCIVDPAMVARTDLPPVSLTSPSISIRDAMEWICRQLGTNMSLSDGGIWIGSERNEPALVAVYNIAPLLQTGRDQPGPQLNYAQTTGGTAGGGAVQAAARPEQAKGPTSDSVIALIRSAITPKVWDNPGNGIIARGNQLLVTAPASTQRLLGSFLKSQEQSGSLMVHIETRWLSIEDGYLEEIGVAWSQGRLLDLAGSHLGASRTNRNSVIEGSANPVLPSNGSLMSTQTSPTAEHGLRLEFGLLGQTQLNAVLTASEEQTRVRTLNAPNLTTLNGVRSNVFVGQQTAYIASYTVVSNNLSPVVQPMTSGNMLDIKPFVSADRKYVSLDMHPAIVDVTYFTDIISAPRITTINENANRILMLISPPVDYPIELPNRRIRAADTTVIIPDRASVLIGGFGRSLDMQTESGIPYLSDIPFAGRLFGRRGRYSEHAKLYLLATTTIMSYEEQEAKL